MRSIGMHGNIASGFRQESLYAVPYGSTSDSVTTPRSVGLPELPGTKTGVSEKAEGKTCVTQAIP